MLSLCFAPRHFNALTCVTELLTFNTFMAQRHRESKGHDHLSRLQKLILVALLDPAYATMRRREFAQFIYRTYFDDELTESMRASLSRSLRKLEERDLIESKHGCWQLTGNVGGPTTPGVVMAFLISAELAKKQQPA
jgi:hypothetical protein